MLVLFSLYSASSFVKISPTYFIIKSPFFNGSRLKSPKPGHTVDLAIAHL